jgi:hypothetical protein
MTGTVLELFHTDAEPNLATEISSKYEEALSLRNKWMSEKREVRNYVFATDTTSTTNSQLDWKHKTTIPKLCQIRDNLHANYMAALFPNEEWLKWEGDGQDDATIEKREAIEAYVRNKLKLSGFKQVVSQLLLDYIDSGNAFCDVTYETNYSTDQETGNKVPGFIGAKLVRIPGSDIIFNPTAPTFKDSYKIHRLVKTLGELRNEAEKYPDRQYNLDIITKVEAFRRAYAGLSQSDQQKVEAYAVDGFGSLSSYYQSNYVEILEFEGTIHDPQSGNLLENRIITVIDRKWIVRDIPNPSWLGTSSKQHVGWRKRPDNLYGMGPLDNLVGMQYRIDHLENMRADVFDLIAYPPLMIKGNVEEFTWAPNEIILLGDDGDVGMLRPDTTSLNADFQIKAYEDRMELYAGAPREAMGMRTPGEKTAFEVDQLITAATRIFQQKVQQFEEELLEPALNHYLEISRRSMDLPEVVRVLDDDLGVEAFVTVTKDDITAAGNLRPVGSKHFAARAQLMQNIQGIFNSKVGEMIAAHVSSKQLSKLVEELFGFEKFALISDNAAVFEQAETQRLIQQAEEEVMTEQATPLEDDNLEGEDTLV